jgi:hypothetical protein
MSGRSWSRLALNTIDRLYMLSGPGPGPGRSPQMMSLPILHVLVTVIANLAAVGAAAFALAWLVWLLPTLIFPLRGGGF